MTVPYSHTAATARPNVLLKLLFFRWDGSVWQLTKLELLIWSLFYLGINRLHFYYKDTVLGLKINIFSTFIRNSENTIMLPFLLGFFTVITITRWWRVYELMQWPDSVASSLAVHLRSKTSKMSEAQIQILRRTLAKYMQLSFVLLLRDISEPMRKRFPSLEAISETQLLNEQELHMIKSLENKVPKRWCLYWLPFQWLFSNLKKCYFFEFRKDYTKSEWKKEVHEGSLFSNKYEYLHVIYELMAYRTRMGNLLDYDCAPSPTLACTQTIIFAVYGFTFFALFSRQNFEAPQDYWFVLTAAVEVGIYLAWLKSTLIMINPFGSDKDDFEVLWLTDRHWRVIYRILDEPWYFFPLTTFTRSAHHARKLSKIISAWPSYIRGSDYRELENKAGASPLPFKLSSFFSRFSRISAGSDNFALDSDSDEIKNL